MNKILQVLKKYPFHVLLIILFFLLDGYKDYVGLVPFKAMLSYFIIIAVATVIIFFLSNLYFRNIVDTGIFISALLLLFLFYGVLQDFLRQSRSFYFLSKNHFLLPACLILLLLIFFSISRTKRSLTQLNSYANILLLIYVVVDMVILTVRSPQSFNKKSQVDISDTTPAAGKPDIFFIVLDEYSGTEVLRQKFQYDNRQFTSFLRDRQFFVPTRPFSNYSYTPFSIAATLNMEYPSWIGPKKDITAKYYTIAAREIANSKVVSLLKSKGYNIRNFSVFDLQEQPSAFDPGFLSLEIRLITDKTMFDRISKAVFWGAGNWTGLNARVRIKEGNNKLIDLTKTEARKKSGSPRFVYSHFMMPHPPFIYDSTGKEFNFAGTAGDSSKNKYVQYLAFTNKVASELIDLILRESKGQAVILILSDHGFRGLGDEGCSIINGNFNAVYLPNRDYHNYYDSISNVNQFPALLNTLFKTDIRHLKDSCAF